MKTISNEEIINVWFEEVWNEGRTDTIDRLLNDNCIVTGLISEEITCCEQFKQF